MAHLIPNIRQKFTTPDGEPAVGWKLYSFEAGTSTPLATYLDAEEVAQNTNPIVLDANGECQIWLGSQAYKFRMDDDQDVPQWTVDGVSHISNGSILTEKILNLAVTTAKLADGSVTETKIGAGAVTADKLGASAVTNAKIANAAVTETKIADDAITTSKLGSGAVTEEKVESALLSRLIQGKNLLINGSFNIWQRGTSFAGLTAIGKYTADRWLGRDSDGSLAMRADQSTDVPTFAQAGVGFRYSVKLAPTIVSGTLQPWHLLRFTQRIIGYDLVQCLGRPLTLSFWVKNSKVGKYCVSFNPAYAATDCYIAEYEITTANTWEKKVITIPSLPVGSGWNLEDETGIEVNFILSAGSEFTDSKDSWLTTNLKYATTDQTHWADSTSNDAYFTGIQLEVGSIATEFELRPIFIERLMCQRFYEILTVEYRGNHPGSAVAEAIGGRTPMRVDKEARKSAVLGPYISTTILDQNLVKTSIHVASGVVRDLIFVGNYTGSSGGPALINATIAVEREL